MRVSMLVAGQAAGHDDGHGPRDHRGVVLGVAFVVAYATRHPDEQAAPEGPSPQSLVRPAWEASCAPVTYSEIRQHLAKRLDHVVDDAEEIVVTRSGREAAVIISLREYESLKEMAYLMASPANARRLNEAVEELRRGARRIGPVHGRRALLHDRTTGMVTPAALIQNS